MARYLYPDIRHERPRDLNKGNSRLSRQKQAHQQRQREEEGEDLPNVPALPAIIKAEQLMVTVRVPVRVPLLSLVRGRSSGPVSSR